MEIYADEPLKQASDGTSETITKYTIEYLRP
jgi:hypothetical protein